jgi:hypothetical protein
MEVIVKKSSDNYLICTRPIEIDSSISTIKSKMKINIIFMGN